MECETRIDPNVTNLLDNDPVTPSDIYSFHNGEGEGGDGLTVAVTDSGIGDHPIFDHYDVTVEHPDVDGLPTNGEDNVGHGTGVAGLVLLNLPNVETLVDVPIFRGSGQARMRWIETAYEYLLSRSDEIDLVNMSWGTSSRIQMIDRLHNELEQSGVNAIVASGNTDQQTGSPATAERAFSVAAVTEEGRMTRFSSPTDDVSALGRNVAVPKAPGTQMGPDLAADQRDEILDEIGGEWVVVSGTSFSCPIVLGYSGSLMTARPQIFDVAEPDLQEHFERAFAATARDVTGTSEDGEGYVDFQAALSWTEPSSEVVDATVWSLSGGADWIHLGGDFLEDGEYELRIDALRDAMTKTST